VFCEVLILAGQKYGGDASVSFREKPYLVVGAGGIGRQDAKPVLHRELVFLLILIRNIAPIATSMSIQELMERLLCLLQGEERTRGCHDLA